MSFLPTKLFLNNVRILALFMIICEFWYVITTAAALLFGIPQSRGFHSECIKRNSNKSNLVKNEFFSTSRIFGECLPVDCILLQNPMCIQGLSMLTSFCSLPQNTEKKLIWIGMDFWLRSNTLSHFILVALQSVFLYRFFTRVEFTFHKRNSV